MSKSVRQRFLGNEITSGFKALSPAEFHRHTETAQRFLASAYDSVEELLITIAMFRELYRQEGFVRWGRIRQNEEDLLRAAILFAGAGLDATLKHSTGSRRAGYETVEPSGGNAEALQDLELECRALLQLKHSR
jgi:hypothetical protein